VRIITTKPIKETNSEHSEWKASLESWHKIAKAADWKNIHADTIAIAVAEPSGEVRSFVVIANRPESVRKLRHKLGSVEQLRVCYESGPTGYVLYWQLTALGVRCEVIAPTLVAVKAGDRVKTDRRDAIKLARSYRAGTLRRCGFLMPPTKLFATWCELVRLLRGINCVLVIA